MTGPKPAPVSRAEYDRLAKQRDALRDPYDFVCTELNVVLRQTLDRVSQEIKDEQLPFALEAVEDAGRSLDAMLEQLRAALAKARGR